VKLSLAFLAAIFLISPLTIAHERNHVPSGFESTQTEQVNGYVKQNGTVVQPYHRTAPDNNFQNNYSTTGNVNPYTNQPGYKKPGY
jgi:hypothetical protein